MLRSLLLILQFLFINNFCHAYSCGDNPHRYHLDQKVIRQNLTREIQRLTALIDDETSRKNAFGIKIEKSVKQRTSLARIKNNLASNSDLLEKCRSVLMRQAEQSVIMAELSLNLKQLLLESPTELLSEHFESVLQLYRNRLTSEELSALEQLSKVVLDLEKSGDDWHRAQSEIINELSQSTSDTLRSILAAMFRHIVSNIDDANELTHFITVHQAEEQEVLRSIEASNAKIQVLNLAIAAQHSAIARSHEIDIEIKTQTRGCNYQMNRAKISPRGF